MLHAAYCALCVVAFLCDSSQWLPGPAHVRGIVNERDRVSWLMPCSVWVPTMLAVFFRPFRSYRVSSDFGWCVNADSAP